MPPPPKPRPGRAWPPASTRDASRLLRGPSRPLGGAVADHASAQLARDLDVLITSGLVVPVWDGAVVRYAVSADEEATA